MRLPILRACYCWDRFAFYLHDGQEGAGCGSSPAHSYSCFVFLLFCICISVTNSFIFCISSISHLYFSHSFPIPIHPTPPSLDPSGLMPHLSLLPPERHLMLVLHHRPLMAAAQIQYSAQVTRPQSNTSLVTGSMTGVGQILTTGRGQQAVVVGRGCSTSCLLHCPPLFAPPHCLPLPTRQPITRQSFKKGHRFYLPPMSAFNAVFCHQSVTFLQQEKKTFGDVEILKCRLC